MRKFFPFLQNNKNLIYFDSAGTSLKLINCIEEVKKYYTHLSVNIHTESSIKIFDEVNKGILTTRKEIADFIGCNDYESIIFTPSTTYSLNILSYSLEHIVEENDEIVLTKLEHNSNFFPWYFLSLRKKATIKFLEIDEYGSISIENIKKVVSKLTKIVTFANVSNTLGSYNETEKIIREIKRINEDCIVIVDACQGISSIKINFSKENIDFLCFSSHKLFGPTGLGIMVVSDKGKKNLKGSFWGGGSKSLNYDFLNKRIVLSKSEIFYQEYEIGTIPLAQIFGFKEVLIKIKEWGWDNLSYKKKILIDYIFEKLSKIKEVIIYSNKGLSKGIILFNIEKYHPHDIAEALMKKNIILRVGSFCSTGLSEIIKKNSAIRISLSIYNTKKEIKKFLFYLKEIIKKPDKLFIL